MRYEIVEGSKSAHCCFEYTVIDKTQPTVYNNVHYKDSKGVLQYESICECFTIEDANLVCNALNKIAELELNNLRLKNCLKSFKHLADDEMKVLIDRAIENF